jgi:hypothetical protein
MERGECHGKYVRLLKLLGRYRHRDFFYVTNLGVEHKFRSFEHVEIPYGDYTIWFIQCGRIFVI